MSGYADVTDNVWMTKAELAVARRIGIRSAHRLVRRQRWERRLAIDGRTRILIPRSWVERRETVGSGCGVAALDQESVKGATRDDSADAVSELHREVARLQTEVESARSAQRQAEVERDRERVARAAAECALAEARQQALDAVKSAEALREPREAYTAEERAERVTRDAAAAQLRRLTQALAERRSLGRWARLRLAWRGE